MKILKVVKCIHEVATSCLYLWFIIIFIYLILKLKFDIPRIFSGTAKFEVYCIVFYSIHMYLLGVAVLELDNHPDHNKGSDPCTLHMS